MNDKLVETVISRAGVVRVRNALNALLWLTAICLPSSILGLYLFRDDDLLKYVFIVGGFLPVGATLLEFFWLLIKDPNRLQSEEFVLGSKNYRLRGKKSPPYRLIRKKLRIAIDARPEKRSLGERP